MSRWIASAVAGLAVFLGMISLVPSGRERELFRNSAGHFRIAPHCEVVASSATGESKPSDSIVEARALLNWRLQYAQHYQTLDQKRALSAVPDSNDTQPASGTISPAGYREIAPASLEQQDSSHQETNPFTGYWRNLEQQTQGQLASLEQAAEESAKRTRPNLTDDLGREPWQLVAKVPQTPSTLFVFLATACALGFVVTRWFMEPERENDTAVEQIQDRWTTDEETDQSVLSNGPSLNHAAALQIVLPGSWLTAKRYSRRVTEFDRTVFWGLCLLILAIVYRCAQEPLGWQRLLWWPLAEIAALWG